MATGTFGIELMYRYRYPCSFQSTIFFLQFNSCINKMFLLSDRVKKKVFIYIRIRIGINILGWIRIRIKQIRTHKIPVKTMHCYR